MGEIMDAAIQKYMDIQEKNLLGGGQKLAYAGRRESASPATGSDMVRVVMALGLTGQFSWQTMQGVPMAQGRQRPRSMKAVPILIGP